MLTVIACILLFLQVNCVESVSSLAKLVYHYKYRTLRQRKVEPRVSEWMNEAYQQVLSCQLPGGGFSLNYGGR